MPFVSLRSESFLLNWLGGFKSTAIRRSVKCQSVQMSSRSIEKSHRCRGVLRTGVGEGGPKLCRQLANSSRVIKKSPCSKTSPPSNVLHLLHYGCITRNPMVLNGRNNPWHHAWVLWLIYGYFWGKFWLWWKIWKCNRMHPSKCHI